MIKSLIQIENGEIQDFMEAFGFIYMGADNRTAPDEKKDAVSNYAEQAGENRDGRTVDAPFDYTARFLVEAPNHDLTNVNVKVNDFNRAIRATSENSDVKRKKEITFYNLAKHVKIVGFPELISVPTECYNSDRGELEYAEVELKIRVSDPSKCDLELKADGSSHIRPDRGLYISLVAHGIDIEVQLSRPLNEDEHVVMLRKGTARTRHIDNLNKPPLSDFGSSSFKRKNRWQVYYKYFDGSGMTVPEYWPFYLDDDGMLRHIDGDDILYSRYTYYCVGNTGYVVIRKSHGSARYKNIKNGITYGIAVYKTIDGGKENIERVSNVAYFRSIYSGKEFDEDSGEWKAFTTIET